MSNEIIPVESIAKTLRGYATKKNPPEDPLIVKTHVYGNIARLRERTIAIVKAPFGSGKTTGIAMKLYHEAMRNKGLARNSHVIIVKVRNALVDSEWFRNYVTADINRIMCGGIYITLFAMAANDKGCYDESSFYCYSTLSPDERQRLENLIKSEPIIRTASKCPDPASVRQSLVKILNSLNRSYVYLVLDEVEGFEERLGSTLNVNLADAIKSYASTARTLYDNNVRNIKLVVLVQSKVIEDKWNEIKNYITQWSPDMDIVCRCPGRQISYPAGSAVEGTTQLINLEYYNSDVYTKYLRDLFNRIVESYENTSTRNLNILHTIIRDLAEYDIRVSRKLAFLEQIAPRIAFEYADSIAETLLTKYLEGHKDIVEAIQLALEDVADEWKTDSGLKRYYAYLIKSNADIFGSSQGIIGASEIEELMKTLLRAIVESITNIDPRNVSAHIERYYSLYTGIALYKEPSGNLGIIVMVFRPSTQSFKMPKKNAINKLVGNLTEYVIDYIHGAPDINTKTVGMTITGLAITRSNARGDVLRGLRTFTNEITRHIREHIRKALGKNTRIPLGIYPVPIVKLSDEDLIVAYMKSKLHEINVDEGQFVEERFRDIVGKIKWELRT